MIHKESAIEERRTLLKENGRDKSVENAASQTHWFVHKNVILGPISLLGETAQRIHTYSLVKEGKVDGEPAYVVAITPIEKTTAGLYGNAWIRKRDGAVFRLEWEPSSLGNHEIAERFSQKLGYTPKLTLTAEFQFEKNGLRFPNEYDVTEAYAGLRTNKGNILTQTTVTYKDYKFFKVETAVDIR